MSVTRSSLSRRLPMIGRPQGRGRRLALVALLALAALQSAGGPVAAQTAGTAGPPPSVAPAITSPPPRIISPQTGTVISAAPDVAPSVAPVVSVSGGPPVAVATAPITAPSVVIPGGLPRAGDGSMLEASTPEAVTPADASE